MTVWDFKRKLQKPSDIVGLMLLSLLLTGLMWDMMWHLSYSSATKVVNRTVYVMEAVLALPAWLYLRPRRDRWLIPLLVGLVWMAVTACIPGVETFLDTVQYLVRAFVLITVMTAIPALLEEGQRRLLMWAVIGMLVGYHAVIAVLGVHAAYTGISISNFTGKYAIGIFGARLRLFFHPVVTGSILCLTALYTIIGLVQTKHKVTRVLYAFALALFAFCLALTNARGPLISFGVALGIVAATVFLPKFAKASAKVLVSIGCVVAMVGVSLLVSGLLVSAFNVTRSAYQDGSLSLMSSANAEDTEEDDEGIEETVSFRDDTDSLSARLVVWQAALELIRSEPSVLLVGTSVPLAKEKINQYTGGASYSHTHNLWLQTLVQLGLPGLLLLIAFQVLLVRACLRVATCECLPLWERLLPILPAAFFAGETVDCIGLITSYNYSLTVVMLS